MVDLLSPYKHEAQSTCKSTKNKKSKIYYIFTVKYVMAFEQIVIYSRVLFPHYHLYNLEQISILKKT